MYAYDYGVRNFDKKYQPFPNITVFNDTIEVLDQENSLFLPDFVYKQVVLNKNDDRFAHILPSGLTYTDIFVKDYAQQFNEFVSTGQSRIVAGFNVVRVIFEFEGNYFVFNPEVFSLDEVEITAKGTGKKQKFPPDLTLLNEQLNGSALSVILFITKDGAKLERAYQKIVQYRDNELVLFVESDDAFNVFGSVVRVNSGTGISSGTAIPYRDIAKLTTTFEIGIPETVIKKILVDHVKDKDSVFYMVRNVFQKGIEIVQIPINFSLTTIADGMELVGKEIGDALKIGEKYWKAYDKEGNPNPEYSPILPGYDQILQVQQANEKLDYDKLLSGFTKRMDDLEGYLQAGIDRIPITILKDFIGNKVTVFFNMIAEGKKFIKEIAKQVISMTKAYFEFLNGFLVGLLNSLVEVVKGIFDLIALICKIVVGISKAQGQLAKTPSSMFSLFVELIESFIEAISKLFSIKNVKLFFLFLLGVFVKLLVSPPSITMDKLGYGIGFLIGFIIEEVVFGIVSGGTKNVADAIRLAAVSYKNLLQGVYKATKWPITFTIDGFLTFIREIYRQFSNFPQLLKNLGKWIDEALAAVKAEAAVSAKFQGLFSLDPLSAIAIRRLGKRTIKKLDEIGVRFGKNSDTGKYEIGYNEEIIRSFDKESDLVEELTRLINKRKDELFKYLEESLSFRKSQINLLEAWDYLSIGGRGRRRGQRLRKSDIRLIERKLRDLEVELELHSLNTTEIIRGFFLSNGSAAKMPKSAAAIFITDGVRMKIVLRKGATIYEFFHEFMHFRHAKELGLKRYLRLGGKGTSGELIKENFVFDKLINNKELLTKEEIEHAFWYINERVRSIFGKEPIIPSFNLEDIPNVRKEININSVINIK